MTAQEKAKWLVEAFAETIPSITTYEDSQTAKQCALIAVDEIMHSHIPVLDNKDYVFWQQVKTEIEKL